MLVFVSLAFATFISEDLACVTAGLLIQRGELSASSAILACTLGILIGDVGLWAAGRVFGRAAFSSPWIARRLDLARSNELRSWLERHAAVAIIGSRFLPGTRLPLYLISGFLELPATVFVGWALVGTVLWTPIVVLLTARVGDALIPYVSPTLGFGWIAYMVTAIAALLALHVVRVAVIRPRVPMSDHGADRGTRWPLDVQGSG